MRGGNVGQTVASGSGQGGGTAASGNHVVRGIVFAALGGICWGFSGTCAQLMTSGFGVPVSWITCVRLLLAAVIFLVVCGVREPRNLLAALRDVRSLGRIAAFALLGVLLTQVSYLSAISYTNAGTGTVLERLGLIVIMVYVCLRMRRLPRIREAAGLVLAIGGTVLIATKGNLGSLAIPAEGLFWGIISAFALAFYTLLPGKVLEKWGSFIVTGLAMLIGGAVATVAVQPWTQSPLRGFSPRACRGHVRHDHRGHVRRLPVLPPGHHRRRPCARGSRRLRRAGVGHGHLGGVAGHAGGRRRRRRLRHDHRHGVPRHRARRGLRRRGLVRRGGIRTFRRSKGAPPSWATTRRAVPRATTSNARRRCWRTVIAPWPRSA